MKIPVFDADWPQSWKESFKYDRLEVLDELTPASLGYAYAYAQRRTQILAAVETHVPKYSHILDIAAAQGNFSLWLAEKGYKVTWNDLRDELTGYVQMKRDHGDVTYRSGNCFDLSFDRLFDAVLVTEIIEHVAHPDDFLKKVSTLVRPGGKIILTTPTGEYFFNRLPKFSECSDPSQYESIQFKPNSNGHIFLLHVNEIRELAARAELMAEEIITYSNVLTSGSAKTNALLAWLPRTIVEAVERLTVTRGRFLRPLNTNTLAVLTRTN